MSLRTIYLGLAILGALAPWAFLIAGFTQTGLAPLAVFEAITATPHATGFAVDLVLTTLTFWLFAATDPERPPRWWVVFPAGALVGPSFALPLYLFLRTPR